MLRAGIFMEVLNPKEEIPIGGMFDTSNRQVRSALRNAQRWACTRFLVLFGELTVVEGQPSHVQ